MMIGKIENMMRYFSLSIYMHVSVCVSVCIRNKSHSLMLFVDLYCKSMHLVIFVPHASLPDTYWIINAQAHTYSKRKYAHLLAFVYSFNDVFCRSSTIYSLFMPEEDFYFLHCTCKSIRCECARMKHWTNSDSMCMRVYVIFDLENTTCALAESCSKCISVQCNLNCAWSCAFIEATTNCCKPFNTPPFTVWI